MARIAKGITRTPWGYRAFVRVKGFPLQAKSFKRDIPIDDIKIWRERTRAKLILQRDEPLRDRPPAGSFRAAVQDYLPQVSAMPSIKERTRDLGVWLEVFGDRPMADVTPAKIRACRNEWLTVGPKRVQRKVGKQWQWRPVDVPLAPGTVNHRLRALSNLFTVLWPKADNPVREVEEAPRGEDVPRSVTYQVVRLVLASMSDQGRAPKSQLRADYSAAKIRALCLACKVITPKELGRMQAVDNRWRDNIIVVSSRKKGRGAPGRIVPLTPDGRKAFRDFHRHALYGAFNVGVVNRALAKACVEANVPRITCYTFRHSYITGIMRATGNIDLARMLAGHRDARTTRPYQLAAELGVLKAGVALFQKSVRAKPA